MNKLSGTVFDPSTPAIVRVSRLAGAAVLTGCAAIFYMLLTI